MGRRPNYLLQTNKPPLQSRVLVQNLGDDGSNAPMFWITTPIHPSQASPMLTGADRICTPKDLEEHCRSLITQHRSTFCRDCEWAHSYGINVGFASVCYPISLFYSTHKWQANAVLWSYKSAFHDNSFYYTFQQRNQKHLSSFWGQWFTQPLIQTVSCPHCIWRSLAIPKRRSLNVI